MRNKQEKERRLKEKNQNNTKKFIEERKIEAMKQEKEKEKLHKLHEKQLEDLTRDIQNVSLQISAIFRVGVLFMSHKPISCNVRLRQLIRNCTFSLIC